MTGLPNTRQPLRWATLLLMLGLLLGLLGTPVDAIAQAPTAPNQQLRALSVRLDGRPLAERIDAYQSGYQVLLPLGELAGLLGLDIQVKAQRGSASGTVLRADQRFALNLAEARVRIGERELSFEPRLALVVGQEIYVSTQLLSRWLPLDLAVDLPSWQLRVKPREPLPMQARLDREAPPAREPITPVPRPPAGARSARDLEASLLVLEVQLDGQILSDSFSAYQDGAQILLPLGELSRLLTLPIQVRPEQGSATGIVLRSERTFALNLAESLISLAGREQGFEPRLATVIGDDIYVSTQLLTRWLPIDLKVRLSALQLQVMPREKLPLQERLERERNAAALAGLPGNAERPSYPRQDSPLGLIGVPFIDQSFGADARFGRGAEQYKSAYTAYLTSDLLGMEGSAYVLKTSDKSSPDLRLTLGRHDPDGGLLGPLRARSFVLGNIIMPSVRNIMQGSPTGSGVAVSNRPLDQPTSFDRHSLRGDLPPGWDVTLYYNDALLAYQSSRADGQYAFDDLPLSFGPNEFRLVFHGPLGQLRVERQSFLLDQASVKPGEFLYALAQHHADNGTVRSVAQAELGISKGLTASAGLVRRPRTGSLEPLSYTQLGLLAYLNSMILSTQLTGMQGGGALAELGLKTRLGSFSLDLLHTQRQGAFENDQFADVAGGVRQRDQLRLNGTLKANGLLPTVTLALDAVRNALDKGPDNYLLGLRASTLLRGTALSNSLRWQRSGEFSNTDGTLQMSRRVANIGLNAQLAYSLQPTAKVQALALTADHSLAAGYQLNGGLLRTLDSQLTLLSAGLSKNFGSFGLALSASYSSQREVAVGMQLFVALDRDPRSGKWSFDGQPLAGTGAVSARAFVDRNMNGIRDPDEELVPNAGFILNGGGRHPRLTDEFGTAFLGRLQPGRYADLALDPATLEDPQWKPLNAGVRVLPRPGRVEMVEFPVIATSEIEGTIYLFDKGRRRGIGDARVELVNAQGQVIATSLSSADGYYLLHQIAPGRHVLRIAREQAEKLKLGGALERAVEVPLDGNFISGQDLELRLASR